MAFSVLHHTIKAATGASGITSDAVDTTGADLIVLEVSSYITVPGVSDSKSNTWTALTNHTDSTQNSRLFYCVNPTVGTGHTFTSTGQYAAIGVLVLSGTHASPFDQESGTAQGSGTTIAPGSLTPSVDGCIVVVGLNYGDGNTLTGGTGFTKQNVNFVNGQTIASAIAYKIQTTAGAENPSYSWTGGGVLANSAVSMAVFKSLAGSPSSSPSPSISSSPSPSISSSPSPSVSSSPSPSASISSSPSPSPSPSISSSPSPSPSAGSPITIAVDDADLFFSPYNWRKSGSTYAESNAPGAYIKTKFSGTSVKLNVDVSMLSGAGVSAGNYPAIEYNVDGGSFTRHQLTSSDTQITMFSGLSDTVHSLEVHFVAVSWNTNDRWNDPDMVVRVTGLELDPLKDVSTPTLRSKRMIAYGDSHTEGHEITSAGVTVANQNARLTFTPMFANLLDAEYGLVGYAGQGYIATGGGGVPNCQDAWDFYSSGQSRLSGGSFSPAPDYIFCHQGTNDSGSSGTNVTTAAEALIDAWRAAATNARIFMCKSPTNTHASNVATAVTNAADSLCFSITSANTYSLNGSHLSEAGHVEYFEDLDAQVLAASGSSPSPSISSSPSPSISSSPSPSISSSPSPSISSSPSPSPSPSISSSPSPSPSPSVSGSPSPSVSSSASSSISSSPSPSPSSGTVFAIKRWNGEAWITLNLS